MKHRILLSSLWIFFCAIAINAQTKATNEKIFPLGVIRQLVSKELNETRTLNIYLPEGYHADSTYAVIYLLDGSADEDFIHVTGLVQFFTFPWVNMLQKSIVVGIANVDRRRDFTFPTTIEKDKKDFPTTGSSEKFIRFIEKELQPYISAQFKTNSSRMLIGQSLGGLLATEILLKKPQLFTDYIIVSPSLWWDKESLLNKPINTIGNKTAVYIAVGEEGKIMEEDAKQLYEKLKSSFGKLHLRFDFIIGKKHANIFHQAVSNGLEFLGEKK